MAKSKKTWRFIIITVVPVLLIFFAAAVLPQAQASRPSLVTTEEGHATRSH